MTIHRILALDPGKVTGYAILDRDHRSFDLLAYGVIDARSNDRRDIDTTHWAWLQEQVRACAHPLILCFEEAILSHRLPSNSEAHEVRGIIRLFGASSHDIEAAYAYAPSLVKKTLTGKGNAPKKLVELAVKRLTGIKRFATDHEPDAIAVGLTYLVEVHSFVLEPVEEAA